MSTENVTARRAFRHALAEVKAAEYAKRERGIEIRKAATAAYFGEEFAIWWSIAFTCRLGKVYEAGDLTRVPGYDTLADSMGREFPEFSDDDGAERLWSFLFSPHDPMPSRDVLERKARELMEYRQGQEAEADRYIPY